MQCPDEIAEVLLRILNVGLLRIRKSGSEGHAEECETEADHIHNLPAILQDYSPELLEYYWNVERAGFLTTEAGRSSRSFQAEWRHLQRLMDEHGVNYHG
ncbi:hypothetical protein [Gimesia maris]|uniref:hypothetical protein n=1 Tax=Gimesia maris TaxID=122 RepID=UPI00118D00F3|nr:hypothetical protein [Gimesia maris]QDU14001.1 hypothetical protein CA11_18050 [Gimesia maris]